MMIVARLLMLSLASIAVLGGCGSSGSGSLSPTPTSTPVRSTATARSTNTAVSTPTRPPAPTATSTTQPTEAPTSTNTPHVQLFEKVSLHVEYSDTDEDGEAVFLIDAGVGLESLDVTAEDGRPVLRLRSSDLGNIGLTKLIIETPEPAFEAVTAAYPEGMYLFRGRTVDGGAMAGAVQLSHALPGPPEIISPANQAVNVPLQTTISWNAADGASGYVVELEQEDLAIVLKADVPNGGTSFEIPGDWLLPDTEYVLGVTAISDNENRTVTEIKFRTAAGAVAASVRSPRPRGGVIPQNFASTVMRVEYSATDDDAEVVFDINAGIGLATLRGLLPAGDGLVTVTSHDLGSLGIQTITAETPEPKLDRIIAAYPAGSYVFDGTAPTGSSLAGDALLGHTLPTAPVITAPVNNATGVPRSIIASWKPVDGAADYAIELEQEDLLIAVKADVPPGKTTFAFPSSWLMPDTDYVFNVAAIASDGNRTISEVRFHTGS